MVILVANVALFILLPALSRKLERHHTHSGLETHVALRLTVFQVCTEAQDVSALFSDFLR